MGAGKVVQALDLAVDIVPEDEAGEFGDADGRPVRARLLIGNRKQQQWRAEYRFKTFSLAGPWVCACAALKPTALSSERKVRGKSDFCVTNMAAPNSEQ